MQIQIHLIVHQIDASSYIFELYASCWSSQSWVFVNGKNDGQDVISTV